MLLTFLKPKNLVHGFCKSVLKAVRMSIQSSLSVILLGSNFTGSVDQLCVVVWKRHRRSVISDRRGFSYGVG